MHTTRQTIAAVMALGALLCVAQVGAWPWPASSSGVATGMPHTYTTTTAEQQQAHTAAVMNGHDDITHDPSIVYTGSAYVEWSLEQQATHHSEHATWRVAATRSDHDDMGHVNAVRALHAQYVVHAAAATQPPPPQVIEVNVVSLGFLSNSGRSTLTATCDASCAAALVRNVSAVLADSSGGAAYVQATNFSVLTLDQTYASSLGCTTTLWAAKAFAKMTGPPPPPGTLTLFLVPDVAGGGSCSTVQARALLGCYSHTTSGCYGFLRTHNPAYWLQAVVAMLGVAPPSAPDASDPTAVTPPGAASPSSPLVRLAVPTRAALGWQLAGPVTELAKPASLAADTPPTVLMSSSLSTSASASEDGPVPLAAVTMTTPTDVWWVSLRTNGDAATLDVSLPPSAANAVHIHRYTPASRSVTLVAQLRVGDVWQDYGVDAFVTVDAIDSSKGVAYLRFGSCMTSPPSVSILPVPVTKGVIAAGTADVTVAVTNNDQLCAPRSFTVVAAPLPALYSCVNVTVVMVPDVNPLEESYVVTTANGAVSVLSGTYRSNTTVICSGGSAGVADVGSAFPGLTATFYDEGGDGYCCRYGGGSYYQVVTNGVVLHTGGTFAYVDTVNFSPQLQWVLPALPSNSTGFQTARIVLPSSAVVGLFNFTVASVT